MKKFIITLLAVAATAAFADNNGNNGNNGGNGGNGGAGGAGGSSYSNQGQGQGQGQLQGQAQGQLQGQAMAQGQGQIATGGDARATSGSASLSVADQRTRVNTAVGQTNTQVTGQTNTQLNGQANAQTSSTTVGGQASTQSMTYNEAPAPSQVRTVVDGVSTVKTAPDVFIGGPASGPCTGMSGGASASWLGGGFGVNMATVSKDCDLREGLRVISMILPTLAGPDKIEAQKTVMAFLRSIRESAGVQLDKPAEPKPAQ